MQIKTAYLSQIQYTLVKLLHVLVWALICTTLTFSYSTRVSAEEHSDVVIPSTAEGLKKLWEIKDKTGRIISEKIQKKVYLQEDESKAYRELKNDILNYINESNEVCRRYAPGSKPYDLFENENLKNEEIGNGVKFFLHYLRKNETKGGFIDPSSFEGGVDKLMDSILLLDEIYTHCANNITNPNNSISTINTGDDTIEPFSFPDETPKIDGLVGSSDCKKDITALQQAVFNNAIEYTEAMTHYQDVLIRSIQSGVKQTKVIGIFGRLSFDKIYQRMIEANQDFQSAVKRYNTEYHKQQCKDKDSGPVIEVDNDTEDRKPLSFNDDNQWKFNVALSTGVTSFKGVKTGINKAVNETVSGGIPRNIISSSAEDSSNHLRIEIGLSKSFSRGKIGVNISYQDIGDMDGFYSFPNQSGGQNIVEGTESLTSYGLGLNYRQNMQNKKWFGLATVGYNWYEDDFSGISYVLAGSNQTIVNQVKTSDRDGSFYGGIGIGYELNKSITILGEYRYDFDRVFESDERFGSFSLGIIRDW